MGTSLEVDMLRERAKVLCELGRYKEAIPLLHRALGMAGDDADLLCRLCSVHYYLKEWKQALKYADAAVATDPESAWAHALRGQVLLVRYRNREAVREAEEAVRLAPHHADYLRPLFHAYIACQRFKDAEQAALRYREARPDHHSPYELLATIAQSKMRTKEAKELLWQAQALNPTSSEIHRRLALLESCRKRTPETFQRLFEAVRLDPANAEARESLSGIAFNFAGTPIMLIGTVAGLLIIVMAACLHVNVGWPYFMLAGLLTIPVIPLHRLRPEWLLCWQPGVKRLPEELRESLLLLWRRNWIAYSAGFCILSILVGVGAMVVFGVFIALTHSAFQK